MTKFEAIFCSVLFLSMFVALFSGHRHQSQGGNESAAGQQNHLSNANSSSSSDAGSSSSRRSPMRSGLEEHTGGTGSDGGSSSSSSSSSSSEADDDQSSDNCSVCGMREAKRSYRLEAVKAEILRKLRLSAPPNVTGKRLPDIPQLRRIIDDHRNRPMDQSDSGNQSNVQTDEEYDDSFATTLKYVLFAQPAPSSVAGEASNVFYFQFQSEMAHQQIVNASISIYVRRTTNPGLTATWLLLYQLRPLPANASVPQERETMRKRKIFMSSLANEGQWITFDLKQYVERWIAHQNVPYGILPQVSDGRGEPLAIVEPQTPEETDRKPYLIIHVRDQGTSRPKRMIDSDCDESSAERRCCRYPLTVDFEQFRWDWVIVPKRYPAYYCSGECPFLYYQRYTHTGLAQQATKLSGTAGGPCCSPRKVSAISMLYYDDYMNIVYGRLPGMVVDQCGCS